MGEAGAASWIEIFNPYVIDKGGSAGDSGKAGWS